MGTTLGQDGYQRTPSHRPSENIVGGLEMRDQGPARFVHARTRAVQWGTLVILGVMACVGAAILERLELSNVGRTLQKTVLLSKSHALHAKHRGSKYSEELSALAKRAGPDRRQALKNLEALRRRSEGEDVHTKGGSKTKEPAALREMEQLAHKRAHSDSRNNVAGLGQLERSHGIKSSKDMLAEIMSLRHYKKNNQEIKNIADGFETHSSFSHRVQNSINKDEAQSRAQQDQANRKSEASALRLEAGRVSRNQMMRATETAAEQRLGAALTSTLKPIQAMLRRDERTLDGMVSKQAQAKQEDGIADTASHRAAHVLEDDLDADVRANIRAQATALRHKSKQYLTKVHAKAKAALTRVVNPDTVRPKEVNTTAVSASSPWSSKVEKFLADTEKFMSKHTASWLGMSTGPTVSQRAQDTVIAATKHNLEKQLRSEEAAEGSATTVGAAGVSKGGLGEVGTNLNPKEGPTAPQTVGAGEESAAVERARGKLAAKKGAEGAPLSSKTKKSWIKALNSYL